PLFDTARNQSELFGAPPVAGWLNPTLLSPELVTSLDQTDQPRSVFCFMSIGSLYETVAKSLAALTLTVEAGAVTAICADAATGTRLSDGTVRHTFLTVLSGPSDESAPARCRGMAGERSVHWMRCLPCY